MRSRIVRRLRPLARGAGALPVVVGVLPFAGRFAAASSFPAGLGQLVPVTP